MLRIGITPSRNIAITVRIVIVDVAAIIKVSHLEMQMRIVMVIGVTPIIVLQQNSPEFLAVGNHLIYTHQDTVRIKMPVE